jgi:DNA repair protein RadC
MKYYDNIPIKGWQEADRPREKALENGVRSLTNAELLATLLSSGSREMSAIDLGRKLIADFGSLKMMARVSAEDFMTVRGIGKAKASILAAGFELARRRLIDDRSELTLHTAQQLKSYFEAYFLDLEHEEFHAVFLNRANLVLGRKVISVGGMDSVHIDPRIVYREAIRYGATAVAFCHNHPSGICEASPPDDAITENLVRIGGVVDVKVMDHIILGEQCYYSYADDGIIKIMENLKEGRRYKRGWKSWTESKRRRYDA